MACHPAGWIPPQEVSSPSGVSGDLRPWLLFLPPFISYESIIHENKQKSVGLCPSSPSGDHPSFQRLHGVGDRELDVPSHVLGLWPALETWVIYKGRNPLCWLSLEKSHENKYKSSFQFANILIFKFKRFHYFLYRQCYICSLFLI
jgi:hypothetical protein